MASDGMEFRVLGPLEVSFGGEPIALGGAKQRAVLAVLLLRAGEVVPVGRLVDEVWGADPPPSAAHTLESYVSRLRQLFNGHGPALVRRGVGYAIELGDATLDAQAFVDLQERAALAAAMDDQAGVVALTAAALALWRGPALADVALASAGRAEADRLEELRLHTYELRFDAELGLGRHERAIGELQSLVAQNPYRERFVAQLMLALYRAGRHAEALEVYEQTRRRLDDDLGLQPSTDLQQLSGQIVRQDSQLRRAATALSTAQPRLVGRRTRRIAEFVLVGSLVAAVMALTASGGAPTPVGDESISAAKRVALVLPVAPDAAPGDDLRIRSTEIALWESADSWGYEMEVIPLSELTPTPGDITRAMRRLERGSFRLVVVLGNGFGAQSLAPVAERQSGTRFVFLDSSLADLDLQGVENATGIRFAEEQSSRLAGYLSALTELRNPSSDAPRVDIVSVVAAVRTPSLVRAVQGFKRGVRTAGRPLDVLVGYGQDPADKTSCERLANEQIDAGSDVVFAMGGACARGALAVTASRGVWGIERGEDRVRPGPHILATSSKWWERSVREAIDGFELESLPKGGDLQLGLADDYAVDLQGKAGAAASVWSDVVKLCSSIRAHSEANA